MLVSRFTRPENKLQASAAPEYAIEVPHTNGIEEL